MSVTFANKFARYLTKADVERLFNDILIKKYGNKLKACEAVGIERKTIYNWERVRDISLETKFKVLKTAFESDLHATLWFIVNTLRRKGGECLFVLLDSIRRRAIDCRDKNTFLIFIELFRRALKELGGPLTEEVSREVESFKESLEFKAVEFGIEPSRLWPEDYPKWWIIRPELRELEEPICLPLTGTAVASSFRIEQRNDMIRTEGEERPSMREMEDVYLFLTMR